MARPNKRAEIEQAAMSLFAQKGSAATSIRDIAQKSGVTEAALYRHFSSKEALIVQLFKNGMHTLLAGLAPLLKSSKPVAQQVDEAVNYMLEEYQQNSETITFLLFDLHAFPQNETMYDLPANPTDLVTDFIARHCPDTNAPLLAGMVMGMLIQPLILSRYGRLTIDQHTAPTIATAVREVLGL